MYFRRGGQPDLFKLILGAKGKNPEEHAKGKGEEATERNEPARDLEPTAHGSDNARQGKGECDENEDGVGNARCNYS